MRMIILSALFAVGVGLAGMGGANAAVVGNGINNAANANPLIEQVQYWRHRSRCRSVRICHRGPWGRRCHWERVCRY
jgi:hypothetical protein